MEHKEDVKTYQSEYPPGIIEGLEGEYCMIRLAVRGLYKYIEMHVRNDINKLGDNPERKIITYIGRSETCRVRDFLTRVRLELHVCYKSFDNLLDQVEISDPTTSLKRYHTYLRAERIAMLLTTLREFFCPPVERNLTPKSFFYELEASGRKEFNELQTQYDRLQCVGELEAALNRCVADMQFVVSEMGGDVPDLFPE